MKKKESEVRKIFVKFRVNDQELQQMKSWKNKSTERNMSNYIRKVVMQKPVLIKHHNQSADEILTGLLQIKNELNAIGNNFNQVVHKLHILDRIPEFRNWLTIYDTSRLSLENKMEQISTRMNQIYEQWLLK